VVLHQPFVPFERITGLASTRTYPLTSSFRPSYNMAVNLVANYAREEAERLLASSFAQFLADRTVHGAEQTLARNARYQAGYLESAACDRGDVAAWWELRRRLRAREGTLADAQRRAEGEEAAEAVRSLQAGTVILLPGGRRRGLAAVLGPAGGRDGSTGVLVLTEDRRVRMPMALAMDGAFLTHSQHMVKIPSPEAAKRFLPQYDLAERRLHPDNPISVAPQANEDWVIEIRRLNWEAAKRARGVIKEAYKEFNNVFGERYSAPYYFEEFMTEDADVVLIGLGTVAAPARTAVRRLREKGQKVGYVNLRWFRPFPTVELRDCLSRFKAVGVVDRDFAHGSPDDCGILMHEVRSCLYPAKNRPAIVNFMGGLGGRDLSIADAQRMYETTQQAATKDSMDGFITWIGLRE